MIMLEDCSYRMTGKRMKRELLKEDQLTYLDGGMGTMLQARGLKPGERPEEF